MIRTNFGVYYRKLYGRTRRNNIGIKCRPQKFYFGHSEFFSNSIPNREPTVFGHAHLLRLSGFKHEAQEVAIVSQKLLSLWMS